jgi:hypothetical protein
MQAVSRKWIAALAVAGFGLVINAGAHAAEPCASCALSNASRGIADASGVVVDGSLMVAAGAGSMVVQSVTAAGEGSVVVLKGVANGVEVSVRVTADVAKGLSNAVGASVQVVAMSTGNMLVMSGKAIAFIPNEIGLALLHQNKLD